MLSEYAYLGQVGSTAFQLAGHNEHRLESSESEVVVILPGQLFTGQLVQHRHLLSQNLPQHETSNYKGSFHAERDR